MPNTITIVGTSLAAAAATDPALCRVSGYLLDVQGQPLAGWGFTLRYCYTPIGIVPSTLLLRERVLVEADADGLVQVDLIRGTELTVEFPNLTNWLDRTTLKVPDAASVDLLAFLLPYPVSVDFEDTGPVTLEVGEHVTASLVATLSNGELSETLPLTAATVVSSNPAVLEEVDAGRFRAVSSGTAQLTVTAVDASEVGQNLDRTGEELLFLDPVTVALPPAPLDVTVT